VKIFATPVDRSSISVGCVAKRKEYLWLLLDFVKKNYANRTSAGVSVEAVTIKQIEQLHSDRGLY
jgi:hypothetical protein